MPAVAFMAAMLSIAMTGHTVSSNNFFHLPILAGLYDVPQFAGDPYIQSLRRYASGFWLLLRGIASGEASLTLLLILQILSRFAFFLSVWAIARPLGLSTRREQSLLLLIVAITSVLRGTAPAGDGGLFIKEFTHSELANATSVFVFALAARQRFGWAVVMTGLTFFINAFMGLWLGLPLAALMILALRRGEVAARSLAVELLWGGAVAGLIVSPVIINIWQSGSVGGSTAFDYRVFLEEYWPDHFLVWTLDGFSLLKLALILVTGLAAAWYLPARSRDLAWTLILSFALLWLIGAALPFVTASQTLLNLHLLRSGAVAVIIAAVTIAALAVKMVLSEDRADRLVWGPGLIATLVLKVALLPAALILVARRIWTPPSRLVRPVFAGTLYALVGAVALVVAIKAAREDMRFRASQADWTRLAHWARSETPDTAVFLLPVFNLRGGGLLPLPARSQQGLTQGMEVFTPFAQRSSWIGAKEGAAVMWSPGFYPLWRSRIIEALLLPDLQRRLVYARSHGIAYVVDECTGASREAVFRSGRLCVYGAGTGAAR